VLPTPSGLLPSTNRVFWAERVGVSIVKQSMGSDPASVAYDSLKSALAKKADVVIIDTAGRLHNRITS
jgi:fused signal recognition particle receptor